MARASRRLLGNHFPRLPQRLGAAGVFRLFGYRESGRQGGVVFPRDVAQPAAYAQALQAGWVPPQQEVPARVGPIARAVEEKSDIAGFLARVYRNQQC
jgi:hypothetical protein